jgi:hypothetical protein
VPDAPDDVQDQAGLEGAEVQEQPRQGIAVPAWLFSQRAGQPVTLKVLLLR